MQQKFIQESDFRQERDFGQKIAASFEFVGAHWRPLGKCLLYFVVPVALVAGVGLGLSANSLFSSSSDNYSVSSAYNTDSPLTWLGLLASLLSYVVLAATVYGYIRLRMEQPADEPVTPSQVGQVIGPQLPGLLLAAVVVALLVGLGMVALLLPGIYLMVGLSLVWATQMLEDATVSGSIRRSLSLTKGYWWSTFGLSFVMSLIISILSIVFQATQFIGAVGKALHWEFLPSGVLIVIGTIISSVGSLLLYSLLMLAYAFQYFNLVEKKDGLGLRHMVATLGTTPAATTQNAHLRPDDEGEY